MIASPAGLSELCPALIQQLTVPMIALAVAILVATGAAIYWGRASEGARRKRLSGREPLTITEFYELFYANQPIPLGTVKSALETLHETLGLDPSRLRPDDTVRITLAPPKGWEFDDGAALLGDMLRREAVRLGVTIDPAAIATVDDFIKAHHRLTSGH